MSDALERAISVARDWKVRESAHDWISEDAEILCDGIEAAVARIAELGAENARLREVAEWQPIETAPRDGTPILIARRDKTWGWIRGWAHWADFPDMLGGWIPHGFFEPPGCLGLAHPSLWRQLPEPPAALAEPEGGTNG